MGAEGVPRGWKVGAGPSSLDQAWLPLCTTECPVAQGCGGAHGWGAPPVPPPHRPGRRGEALAGVSGPSAGHVQCGLNSQGSLLPSWPLAILFLRGAPPPTLPPFWVNWIHEDKAEIASHTQNREAVTFGNLGAPTFYMKTRSSLLSTGHFPKGFCWRRPQQLRAFP